MIKTVVYRIRRFGPELLVAFIVAACVAAAYSVPARAALTISSDSRTSMANALLADIAGGSIEVWGGVKPAALGTPSGTLLATLHLGSPAGTASGGVLTLGAVTQNAATHVNGNPTFVRFKSAGGVVRMDIDIGAGAGNLQFAGTVATGQVIVLTGEPITMPNA